MKLSMDDVITCGSNRLVGALTFKVEEATRRLTRQAEIDWSTWTKDGVPCQIIGQNTEGWRKGKVRLCFEFIPDEPITPKTSTAAESPLDDLRRQQVNQSNGSPLP